MVMDTNIHLNVFSCTYSQNLAGENIDKNMKRVLGIPFHTVEEQDSIIHIAYV